MARFDQPIEPMTLGNMRELGVWSSATRPMQREWRLPTSRQGGWGALVPARSGSLCALWGRAKASVLRRRGNRTLKVSNMPPTSRGALPHHAMAEPRMVCTSCGIVGADAGPNWKERPPREMLAGVQWRS
jgi:hypothetical protein